MAADSRSLVKTPFKGPCMVLRESHLENPATLASSKSGRLPKLALLRHAVVVRGGPLSGVKQTSRLRPPTSEFDPTATLVVHRGNGFDAGFRPYQSARLSRYNAGPQSSLVSIVGRSYKLKLWNSARRSWSVTKTGGISDANNASCGLRSGFRWVNYDRRCLGSNSHCLHGVGRTLVSRRLYLRRCCSHGRISWRNREWRVAASRQCGIRKWILEPDHLHDADGLHRDRWLCRCHLGASAATYPQPCQTTENRYRGGWTRRRGCHDRLAAQLGVQPHCRRLASPRAGGAA